MSAASASPRHSAGSASAVGPKSSGAGLAAAPECIFERRVGHDDNVVGVDFDVGAHVVIPSRG